MVTIAAALLAIGYTLFYVAASNLAHGPGKGVGFTEALGFGSPPPTSSPAAPAQSRATAPSGKPKPGTAPASKIPTSQAQLDDTVNRLASGGHL